MNFSRTDKIQILENAISWIVVLAMIIYGGSKPFQFSDPAMIKKAVSELNGMELMWAFYGYSKGFAMTIGFFEIVGAILILIRKTRIIGCLVTSTVLVNIILQDIFYGVHLGALTAAIIYQTIILIILWLHRTKIVHGLKALFIQNEAKRNKNHLLLKFTLTFLLFVVLRIIEYYLTIGITPGN